MPRNKIQLSSICKNIFSADRNGKFLHAWIKVRVNKRNWFFLKEHDYLYIFSIECYWSLDGKIDIDFFSTFKGLFVALA